MASAVPSAPEPREGSAEVSTDAGARRPAHVVITGASSGIGAALAARYARTVDRLTLIARDESRLDATAALCRAAGCETEWLSIDVSNASVMHAALDRLDDRRPVDIVIGNAGLGGVRAMAGPNGENPGSAAEIAAVNFSGLIHTIAPLVPRFVERRAGHVVIVSSLAAVPPMPLAPTYAASKAGAASYAANLRRFLRASGVPVTLVTPAFVETPMSDEISGFKPFIISSDQAAALIVEAVARRQRHLRFPWQLHALAQLARYAPDALVDLTLACWRRSVQ